MREILFRGQTRRKGEKVRISDGGPVESNWVYGGVFQGNGDFSIIYTYDPIEKKTVYSDTIGQYTGLTDKNGKKIFEGDVLNTPNGKWLVVAVRGGFGVVRRGFMSDYDAKMGFHSGISEPQNTVYTEENAEVIGNIHDNPELLEV